MITTTKYKLQRQYHTLASKLKLTDNDKQAVLSSFGAASSKDLSEECLQELCRLLKQRLNDGLDLWRKRVIASIYGYLQLTGRKGSLQYVKAIACRSSDYDDFNSIPQQKLINLYYTFLDKQKVLKQTGALMDADFELLQFKN